jgi:AraC-like DNA-binding protein
MYLPQDFQKAGVGVFPLSAGVHVGKGDWVAQRLIHQGMGVSYDIEGCAFEQNPQGDFLVRPGQVICLWPQTWHQVAEHEGKPLQTIWMELSGPAVPDVAQLFGATPRAPISKPSNPQEVHELFREIVAGFHSPDRLHPGHFLQRFYRIAELCAEGSRRGAPARRSAETLAQRAIRILETGMLIFPTVAQLATELGVSQNTLLNACRSELGISAVELITRVKLQKARELLRITDYKLLHIAQACGFRSLSHFMHAFRKAEHATPGEWRDQRGKAKR